MRVVLEACGASPCLPFSFAVNLKRLLKKWSLNKKVSRYWSVWAECTSSPCSLCTTRNSLRLKKKNRHYPYQKKYIYIFKKREKGLIPAPIFLEMWDPFCLSVFPLYRHGIERESSLLTAKQQNGFKCVHYGFWHIPLLVRVQQPGEEGLCLQGRPDSSSHTVMQVWEELNGGIFSFFGAKSEI